MPIPAKLYKYRSLKSEFTEKIFRENTFYYGCGSTFNDPFDCNFDLRTAKTDEEWANLAGTQLNRLATLVRNGLSGAVGQFAAFVRSRQKEGAASNEAGTEKLLEKLDAIAKPREPATNEGKYHVTVEVDGVKQSLAEWANPTEARRAAEIMKLLDESFGVNCLSERCDDILMWSHYAENHTGICLELDTAGHANAFPRLGPVQYADKYPELVEGFYNLVSMFRDRTNLLLDLAALESGPDELAAFQLCVHHWFYQKFTCWSGEREWRSLVKKPGEKRFPAAALSGVIVGCKSTDKDIEDIRRWVRGRRRKVKLYRAVRRPYEFALDVVPLD